MSGDQGYTRHNHHLQRRPYGPLSPGDALIHFQTNQRGRQNGCSRVRHSRRQPTTAHPHPWYQQGTTTIMSSLAHGLMAPHTQFQSVIHELAGDERPLVRPPTCTSMVLPSPNTTLAGGKGSYGQQGKPAI
jgi:hypothetical protein